MKITQLLAVLLLVVQGALAQHPYDSDISPIKDILPPSPTATGLGLYGEIPISLHTGIPKVSIPLCAIKERSLSVPISLSYHGGGNQVDAISSWVGLGWSLNAGGVVTRTVNGLPDDQAQFGYWSQNIPDDAFLTNTTNPVTQQEAYAANAYYNYVTEYAKGRRDGRPDQFNFNINGYAGRFYIEYSNGNLLPRLVPHQNIKIELDRNGSTLVGLTLTTPEGVKYKFGGHGINGVECVEKSKHNSSGYNCSRNYDRPVITSWYLREIESPNEKEQIYLDYEQHTITYDAGASEVMAYVSEIST